MFYKKLGVKCKAINYKDVGYPRFVDDMFQHECCR